MALLALNILAATTAATIYALWSLKWWHRGAWGLAGLNLLIGLTSVGVAIAYAALIVGQDSPDLQRGLRSLVPLLLLLPAITRLAEMRRDERREEVAKSLHRRLLDDALLSGKS